MSKHHDIDYIEFGMLDLAAAKAFYTQVFGWRFSDYGPGYCGFKTQARVVDAEHGDAAEREAGGFCLVDEVTQGGVLPVLWSDDLEASRERVTAAGGVIDKDIFEFPGGRRFEFFDPSGNRLAIWSAPG